MAPPVQPPAQPDIFEAIASPVRRDVLDMLRAGPRPVRTIASQFTISRPAVSQHLRVLLDAGLVAEERSGRERVYQLRPERLHEVDDWLAGYEEFWRGRLRDLGTLLDETED